MAKIVGPVQYSGKIGDFSAYIDKNGENIVRGRGGPSGKRVKKEDRFRRFMNQGSVNGAGSSNGKIIRDGFAFITRDCKDGSLTERLKKALKQAFFQLHPQEVTPDIFYEADLGLLQGFQWNDRSHLDAVFHADHTTMVNPETGDTDFIIASFCPEKELTPPPDATHFTVVVATLFFRQGSKLPGPHLKRLEKIACDAPNVHASNIRFSAGPDKPSLVISGVGVIFFGKVRTKVKVLPESAFAITNVCRLP